MIFKAAILEKINQPLVVGNVESNELEVGQVLVRVVMSGLCGAQLQEKRGEKNNSQYVPHLLGHEGCGIVQGIGPGVTQLKYGDKVIMHWRVGSGIESAYPFYTYKDRVISGGKVTTLSQYTVASQNRLTKVDSNTPDDLCTLLGCGLSTALGVINNDAKIKFGESVLVLGCGGVGISIVMAARSAGAGDIHVYDEFIYKSIFTARYNVIFHTPENASIKSKIDCIVDTTGSTDLVSQYLPILSDRGRVIMICQPREGSLLTIKNPSNLFLGEGQTLCTTQGGKMNPTTDLPRYINFFNTNKIIPSNLVSHIFPLDDINLAIETLKSGKAGRILIRM